MSLRDFRCRTLYKLRSSQDFFFNVLGKELKKRVCVSTVVSSIPSHLTGSGSFSPKSLNVDNQTESLNSETPVRFSTFISHQNTNRGKLVILNFGKFTGFERTILSKLLDIEEQNKQILDLLTKRGNIHYDTDVSSELPFELPITNNHELTNVENFLGNERIYKDFVSLCYNLY